MDKTREVDLDATDLWRRVGLQELREALAKVEALMARFQESLKKLPACDECARAALLEQIRAASKQVGIEAVSVSVLAESLKEAVGAAENTQALLHANAPDPCRCPTGQCICHG